MTTLDFPETANPLPVAAAAPRTCTCGGHGCASNPLPAALRLDLRRAREAAIDALNQYAEQLSDPVLEHLIYGVAHSSDALIELLDRHLHGRDTH